MASLTERILPRLAPLYDASRIVVAYSGGMDSEVLLSLLAEIGGEERGFKLPPLTALHVNHGISANAAAWETHCQRRCAELNIPLTLVRLAALDSAANLEARLRQMRYEVFAEHLAVGDILLLAHHAQDQVETALLRLLRGAGVKGMAAMPPSRSLHEARLLRPLLDIARDELLEYAKLRRLCWVEDESNTDSRFDRNFLRHEVLPLIKRRWPSMDKTVARFAGISRQTEQALSFFARRELKRGLTGDEGLSIAALAGYPREVQFALLRAWVESLDLPDLSFRQYELLLDEVLCARPDAQPKLQLGEIEFQRHKGCLLALISPAAMDTALRIPWMAGQALALQGAGTLTADYVEAADKRGSDKSGTDLVRPRDDYEVGFRQGGERCRPLRGQGSRPLKKILQDLNIPVWLRDRVPILYAGNEIAAIADLLVCQGFEAEEGEPGWRLTWQRPKIRAGETD